MGQDSQAGFSSVVIPHPLLQSRRLQVWASDRWTSQQLAVRGVAGLPFLAAGSCSCSHSLSGSRMWICAGRETAIRFGTVVIDRTPRNPTAVKVELKA